MKNLFQFLVIIALVVLGYFVYPMAADFMQEKGWLAEKAATPPAPPEAGTPAPGPVTPVPPVPEPETITPPTPAPIPPSDEIAKLIPMPKIKSLEEITEDWKNVPDRAFPETVTIQIPLEFAMSAGNSMKLGEGRPVRPLDLAADGTLSVAPSKGSLLKASLPVEKTDFKELVTKRYNEGVAQIHANIAARRDAERQRIATAAKTTEAKKAEAGTVPKNASDEERYLALMKNSVAQGELEGVTTDKVQAWRWIGYEEKNGIGYWTGSATVMKSTYFGDFETEARALIRNDKIERWVWPGTDEN